MPESASEVSSHWSDFSPPLYQRTETFLLPKAGLSKWKQDSMPTQQVFFFFRLSISSTFHFSAYKLCLCSYIFVALK